ncbi:MAG: amidohydrolase family protein [Acidobacteria bacterium]|nr:amidohydrolase family protein [Acidobacteriota bacterium]
MNTIARGARGLRWSILLAVLALVTNVAAQQPGDLIIRNGLIVTAVGRTEGDLRIRNATIAEIGRNLTAASGARVIDAKRMLVLPGGVDPHVHLTPTRTPTTLKGADDYTSGSRAALAGGKTTISNFITQTATTNLQTTLAEATELVRKQAIADVILHVTASDPNGFTASDVATLADRGFTLKIFLVRPAFDQNAAGFVKLIRAAGAAGLLTMLHCEDASLVTTTQERMMAEGRGALKGQNFAESRPVVAEEIATERAVGISEATGAPIYIVHISSERAMRAAEAGQARGLPVFTEVRFLYLHLTRERFDEPDGAIYTGDPPLREKRDADYLWRALARGTVNVVDTDHVGYTREDKLDPSLDIINHRPAGNYLQVQLPLLYSEGVRKGRITLERMVALTSTNPAKLFGLYPRKGTIAVGSDADVVIWDPNLKRTIRDEDQLANAKFSIFSGWEVTGWPIVTIRRGEVVYEGGKILAAAGSGQLAPRQHWQRP